ncbi:hypothetical protein PVK06_038344 [Gossypium arboreum]|uniref:Uncharacterized protein n=1 Tax=Gossypium arboreum TaxID=29729 RepID=A0ABR0MZX3_GOSAR|nr:hypothetical protein PVK06_038344 [Gossypium arboreum]
MMGNQSQGEGKESTVGSLATMANMTATPSAFGPQMQVGRKKHCNLKDTQNYQPYTKVYSPIHLTPKELLYMAFLNIYIKDQTIMLYIPIKLLPNHSIHNNYNLSSIRLILSFTKHNPIFKLIII